MYHDRDLFFCVAACRGVVVRFGSGPACLRGGKLERRPSRARLEMAQVLLDFPEYSPLCAFCDVVHLRLVDQEIGGFRFEILRTLFVSPLDS